MVKVYVDGKDNTSIAFPQGNNLEKEVAFLMWWPRVRDTSLPMASTIGHRSRVHVYCPMVSRTLIGVKEKDGRLLRCTSKT